MKAHDDFDNAKALATELVKLFFFTVVAAFALYYDDWYRSSKARELIRLSIFLMIFGTLHLVFSKSLSFLYNMQKTIIPIAPTATPKFLRYIGAACLGFGLLVFFYNI